MRTHPDTGLMIADLLQLARFWLCRLMSFTTAFHIFRWCFVQFGRRCEFLESIFDMAYFLCVCHINIQSELAALNISRAQRGIVLSWTYQLWNFFSELHLYPKIFHFLRREIISISRAHKFR